MSLSLLHCDGHGIRWAQAMVRTHHYLHTAVDPRSSPEVWAVRLAGVPGFVGCLIVGRPEATRCRDWYGSVDDVQAGRCEVTRWQVCNLARVWLSPDVQRGGALYGPDLLSGYTDRKGVWRSTLASAAIRLLVRRVGCEYLLRRPPVYLDEPYEIRWLLSYCNTTLHRGAIYRAAGWERYAINAAGIETWRVRLLPLGVDEDAWVRRAAEQHPRSRRYRSMRAELLRPVALAL